MEYVIKLIFFYQINYTSQIKLKVVKNIMNRVTRLFLLVTLLSAALAFTAHTPNEG
jgi:hypothetical protein